MYGAEKLQVQMASRQQLINELKKRQQILDIAKSYPLSVSKLWVPHCHRWDGQANNSKRIKGCGQPMERLAPSIWKCNNCEITETRTSQRDPLLNLGREATLIAGGNRAGKTEIAAQLAVAWANGSKCFWVKQWMELNHIPEGIIPKNPSTVVVSALSYADALTYVRPKISKYAPLKETKHRKWRAQDRASLLFENGGEIISMSADSGRDKYQGFSASLIILDEEHPRDIYDECLMRVVDTKGKIVLTMTPLKGLTWVYDLFIDKPIDGYVTHKIIGLDNPWISSVKLARAVRHMSDAGKASRLMGEFTNQQGLVYPEVRPETHIIKSFKPPSDWPIDLTIDFGVRNPFACLVTAWDPTDDTLHVIDEYFKTEFTTLQNGRAINQKFKKYFPIRWAVADPESRDGRLILARECNIPTKIAPKSMGIIDTINLVKERLALDANGKSHLVIHDNCVNLIKEFRLYRWSENSGKQTVIKKYDHGLDALRYQCAFLYRYLRHL